MTADASRVDNGVQPAEASEHPLDGSLHPGRIRHVSDDRQHLPEPAEIGRSRPEPIEVAVEQADVEAVRQAPPRRDRLDPRCRAGDQDRSAGTSGTRRPRSALQAGTIDCVNRFTVAISPQLITGGHNVVDIKSSAHRELSMGNDIAPFTSNSVRQAIALLAKGGIPRGFSTPLLTEELQEMLDIAQIVKEPAAKADGDIKLSVTSCTQ